MKHLDPFCLLSPASKWRSIRVAEGPVNWQLPIESFKKKKKKTPRWISSALNEFFPVFCPFVSRATTLLPFSRFAAVQIKVKHTWRTLLQISHTCLALIENWNELSSWFSWFQSSWLIVKCKRNKNIYIIIKFKEGTKKNVKQFRHSLYLLRKFLNGERRKDSPFSYY